MRLSVVAIKALETNYIWLIKSATSAIVIDPGAAAPVLDYLKQHSLDLHAIWVTHHHSDHIDGVDTLLKAYPTATLYAHKDHNLSHLSPVFVDEDEATNMDAFGMPVTVWRTFGHTKSHLSYLVDGRVFCADTLFLAGCGRVFCGTIGQLYQSFLRFDTLQDDTIFYPAHEYSLDNLAFAQSLEPSNSAIKEALTQNKNIRLDDRPTLPTTLATERQINPFMRALHAKKNDELWLGAERQSGRSIDHNSELFATLRALKDNF